MLKLSEEQRHVVESLATHNIIVDAVAGSGKTTTMLQMARQYPHWKFLLLTYNSKLRLEGVEKAKDIPNITIHTFHSFCYKYVSTDCTTDNGIIDFINSGSTLRAVKDLVVNRDIDYNAKAKSGFSDEVSNVVSTGIATSVGTTTDTNTLKPHRVVTQRVNTVGGFSDAACTVTAKNVSVMKPNQVFSVPYYDVIIIDEAQDMTPLYYKLTRTIISAQASIDGYVPHLCVVGDKYQSIYGYAGSDLRYITYADKVYPALRPWRHCDMKTSYRVTRQVATFVNRLLGEERVQAVKYGPPITYSVTHSFDLNELVRGVRESLLTYKPEQIFIVTQSIRSKSINRVATAISRYGYVYVPNDDMGRLNDDVCAGKIVFSSYHQVKGLERPCVHVLNFDNDYYVHAGEPENTLANVHYVALTRSLETLYVYQCGRPVKFLVKDGLRLMGGEPAPFKERDTSRKSVTDLVRHIPSDTLYKLMKLVDVETIAPAGTVVQLEAVSKQSSGALKYAEFVADINGTAVNAEFEYMIKKNCTALTHLRTMRGYKNTRMVPNLEKSNGTSIMNSLEVALHFQVLESGASYRARQIKKINWGSAPVMRELVNRLKMYLGDVNKEKPAFERGYSMMYQTARKSITVNGYADIVTATRIIELKAVSQLKPEHILQLILYSYMHQLKYGTTLPAELYNVCTGEVLRVSSKSPIAVINLLMCNKYHKKEKLTDEQFVAGAEARCTLCEGGGN